MCCQGLVVSVPQRPKIQEGLQIKNHYTTLNLSRTTDSLSECQIGRRIGSISTSPILSEIHVNYEERHTNKK
jgi:hypothetical protein